MSRSPPSRLSPSRSPLSPLTCTAEDVRDSVDLDVGVNLWSRAGGNPLGETLVDRLADELLYNERGNEVIMLKHVTEVDADG